MNIRLHRRLIAFLGVACMLVAVPVEGQILQDGDYVIAANRYTGGSFYGRFFRLRGQDLTLLFESGASGINFAQPGDVVIDSQGRVVFGAGSCGLNANNSALLRWDPVTGVLSHVLCIPYNVNIEAAPPGFPPEATSFYGVNGLHATRSLKVSIDDDVSGGTPQVGFAEAYGFSVAVFPRQVFISGQWYDRYHPEAFRYIVDENSVEPGISTAFIPVGSNVGAEMFADSGATYYSQSQGSRIFRAEADLTIDVRARTTIGGAEVVVSGRLRVAGRNEQVVGPGPSEYPYLDNTAVPNVTVICNNNGVDVTDTNNPLEPDGGLRPLSDIRSLGVLNGGIFVSTTSPSSAFFFDLGPRDPFLITYYCSYFNCTQGFGPYASSVDRPYLAYTTVHNGRILGGDDVYPSGRVFSVNASTFQLLSDDPLLVRPRGVAQYPPETPALTAATLVLRVDSPVNVLMTDASGRRIGHDAAGNTVNDFGASGAILALGTEGHPRIFAVINPPVGTYGLQAVGTANGPYAIRSYLAETSSGGAFITRTGQAQTGVAEDLSLRIKGPLTQAWLQLGDMNCDSAINQNDVEPFVQALLNPTAYEAQHPACELFNADMNRDSGVNGGDIQPFLARVIQG